MKKFKKLEISPVTGQKAEDETEKKWIKTAIKVKERIGMNPTDIETTLTQPELIEPLIDKAPKKEVAAIMMKTIQDLDKDRVMGKRLAYNLVQRKGLINPTSTEQIESLPVTTSTVKKNKNAPKATPGLEIEESRPFTQAELNDLRKEYAQNGSTDAEYMLRLWEKGADTVMLTSNEMSRLKGCIENPGVFDALEHVLHVGRNDTHPLLDWITAAWRLAYPHLDLTQFETAGQWDTYEKVIRILRKLGMLYFIYNAIPTPQAAPMIPSFRRIVIKGAPNNIRMTIAGPLANCLTVSDAITYFKEFRELQQEKVVSLNVGVKHRKQWTQRIRPYLPKIRPFGNPRTLYTPYTRPWKPLARVVGRPSTPWGKPRKEMDTRRPGGGPIRNQIRRRPQMNQRRNFLGNPPPMRRDASNKALGNIRKRQEYP